MKLREGLVQVSEPLANALVSPIHRLFSSHRHQNRRMPLNLGVEFRQQPFGISPVDRVKRAFEDLDVLLRHRLLRQPGSRVVDLDRGAALLPL